MVAPILIIPTDYAPIAYADEFTVDAGFVGVRVDDLIFANRTAGPITIAARVVPSGGTPGNEHEVFPSKSLAAGEVYRAGPFWMFPGEILQTQAGAASSIVQRASGRAYTS